MKAFVSIISTDNYSLGAIILYESLKLTGTQFPFFLVVTQDVSIDCEILLKKYGIKIIRDNDRLWTSDIRININEKRWSYSFDKLKIFKLEQFSKIVYLDSDMYVVANIDSLFTYSHLTAVPTRSKMKWLNNQRYFNSGIMVIEPSKNEFIRITKFLKPTIDEFYKRNVALGDQDVLHNSFLDWPLKSHLHLADGFNVFWSSIDLYLRKYNYTLKKDNTKNQIYVIHFTGSHKPWMKSFIFILLSVIRPIKNLQTIPLKSVINFIFFYRKMVMDVQTKLSKIQNG